MDNDEGIITRFLLLSDTHAKAPSHQSSPHPCRWPLPKADVAIHTGDLTLTGTLKEHQHAIETLKSLPADLKIVIPGNHDLTLDTKYCANQGVLYGHRSKPTLEQLEEIRNLYTGSEAQAAKIIYLEEGTQTLNLKNGATLTIYASAYTPEFCGWAFAYPRDQDRFNTSDAENPVVEYTADDETTASIDVMLTHGPPFGILDKVDNKAAGDAAHVGCEHLLHAVARAKPLLHCFGHIHEGWGATKKSWSPDDAALPGKFSSSREIAATCTPIEVNMTKVANKMGVFLDATDIKRGGETLFVNSSIMDVRYKPGQAPWIVDLMLPRQK